jgi:hypothetical protein
MNTTQTVQNTQDDWAKAAQPSALGVASARFQNLRRYLEQKRQETLESTPAAIVNNSSNIIGAMDIAGEMMVFKATVSNLISRGNHGKPLHYIIDPPRNLFRSVASRASFNVSLKDLTNPQFYRESVAEFTDLEKASKRDMRRGRLINRWQARAMFSSLVGMSASAVIPQQRDDSEENLQMGELWHQSTTRYVGKRFSQALWPPGWGDHKTQFAGLAKTTAGAFSFLSSYRNVAEGKKYFHNPAHGITALVTMAGGLQLMLGTDTEQSWRNYGATNWLRIPLLPASIMKRFYERDRRAVWYAGSVGVFQLENTFAFLVGGAEKDKHGNIIDKKAIREQAAQSRMLFADAPQLAVEASSARTEDMIPKTQPEKAA